MKTSELPVTIGPSGVHLAVRLTPRASRSEIGGIVAGAGGQPALAIRVASPPVDGAANKALVTLLAERLGLPRRAVSIRTGETSRLKILAIEGDAAAICARLLEAVKE